MLKEVNAVSELLQSRFREILNAGCLSQVQVIPNCSILAAVGQKIACTPRVSATLFNALAKANINVCAIAHGCTEYKITVVIKQEDCIRAPRAVHFRLYLSRTAIAVGNIRPALIGVTLFDQLRDQRKLLLSTVQLLYLRTFYKFFSLLVFSNFNLFHCIFYI
ncbi:bifunctional aspartokinase/homoserine dehydrogenase 1, chloroplastic-like isoform X2 [Pyrus communis]|uniref:bifunctional aspartokinase/homoserine dehydrogenase 1, chloroplastic-like isoform X2 n=1 Tax=Pyrus communis TaxID=23211 RepID=UPI0035C24DB5